MLSSKTLSRLEQEVALQAQYNLDMAEGRALVDSVTQQVNGISRKNTFVVIKS